LISFSLLESNIILKSIDILTTSVLSDVYFALIFILLIFLDKKIL